MLHARLVVPFLLLVSSTIACSSGDVAESSTDFERDDATSLFGGVSLGGPGSLPQAPPTSRQCDASAEAGRGWVNTSMSASGGAFVVQFRVSLTGPTSGREPIDAVIGLSSGLATSVASLGPAVRFNANGYLDARNGPKHEADALFPYTYHDGPYELRLEVDVDSHTYSVWARHLDGVSKPFERIASRYAFGPDQPSVASLDNVARFVDGNAGAVLTCGFAHHAGNDVDAARLYR